MKFFINVALAALTAIQGGLAHPQRGRLDYPPGLYCVVIDKEEQFSGQAYNAGNSGPPGTNLAFQQSYVAGTTFSVGFDLGLSFTSVTNGAGASAGLSFSVAWSFEKGTTIGVEQVCPEDPHKFGYICSIMIVPGYKRITGKAWKAGDSNRPPDKCEPVESREMQKKGPGPHPFVMESPMKQANNQPFFYAEKCVCPNHGNSDPEKTGIKRCPQNCAIPGGR